jgi:hypothetical protein
MLESRAPDVGMARHSAYVFSYIQFRLNSISALGRQPLRQAKPLRQE